MFQSQSTVLRTPTTSIVPRASIYTTQTIPNCTTQGQDIRTTKENQSGIALSFPRSQYGRISPSRHTTAPCVWQEFRCAFLSLSFFFFFFYFGKELRRHFAYFSLSSCHCLLLFSFLSLHPAVFFSLLSLCRTKKQAHFSHQRGDCVFFSCCRHCRCAGRDG